MRVDNSALTGETDPLLRSDKVKKIFKILEKLKKKNSNKYLFLKFKNLVY